MKRQNRIRKNQDFKKIIGKHRIIKSNSYIIYVDKNNLGYARLGVSVSSKLGNAVTRNHIKRQIKAMMNELLDLKQNNDIIIVARDECKKQTYQQNFKTLKGIIEKLQ